MSGFLFCYQMKHRFHPSAHIPIFLSSNLSLHHPSRAPVHQYSCISVEVAQVEQNLETQTLGNVGPFFRETCLDSPGWKSRKHRKPTETYVTLYLCSYVLVDTSFLVSGFPGSRKPENLWKPAETRI